jgi:hypothetical protein
MALDGSTQIRFPFYSFTKRNQLYGNQRHEARRCRWRKIAGLKSFLCLESLFPFGLIIQAVIQPLATLGSPYNRGFRRHKMWTDRAC